MNISLLQWLCCPFCAGNLNPCGTDQIEGELEYDILTCHCGRYPIVAGIPVLKRGAIGTARQTADDVTGLIKSGRYREALLSVILPPPPAGPALAPAWMQSLPSVRGINRLKRLAHQRASRRWREQAAAFLTDPGDQVTACDLLDFYYHRSGFKMTNAYDYFAFRFGQPRHLVALSFTSLIHTPRKPILDLACGYGHITRSLVRRAKGQPVIGADPNFIGLYVAKTFIAPEAEYVCCVTDASLPFRNGSFSTAFCSDAFHLFINKATCFRELKRLTHENGLIMLVGLCNALSKYPYAGEPLSPEGYQGLLADMPHCLVPDRAVLTRYLQKQGPPLARSSEIGRLAYEPTLSVVASHRHEVFQDYGSFQDWPHAEGRLGLNPLYTEERRDGLGNLHLRRTFPTAWYEEHNAECKQYLPEAVSVDSKVLSHLAQGERTPEVEKLIEQCVVLGMPARYR